MESQINPGVTPSIADDSLREKNFQLIVGKENFLSLVTSCIVCVIKAEPNVVDHLLSWGLVHRLCLFLGRAIDGDRRGSPVTSVARVLFQLVYLPDILDDMVNSNTELMRLLMRVLDANDVMNTSFAGKVTLPSETTLFVELIKKIFQCRGCRCLPYFVVNAIQAKMPHFLLEHIVGTNRLSF